VKTYVVGGAVRDELLGLPVKDRDWVVVGATPEEMLAKGFKPVGKDFPVFLHPDTKEEYALARTERKSGRGYKGFTVQAAPDVTLEDDLRRRDLTINAIAKDESGKLIDPFHGREDLRRGLLRHVSPAFAEDPVRILRVARFAARFSFPVAKETLALMRKMVRSGETDYLVAERVWQEFSKGLMEEQPERMFRVLESTGLKLVPKPKCKLSGSLPVRFALLAWPLEEKEVEALCKRLRVPGEVRELALLASQNRDRIRSIKGAKAFLDLLKRTDAFRRPERFRQFLEVVRVAAPRVDTARIRNAHAAAAAVDAGAAAGTATGKEAGKRVDAARLGAIKSVSRSARRAAKG
jgi:tRNA nucleotidyltransferase (CCA-adding enzyme)